MIDFHTHIIPGIDDGAQSVKTTVNLLREAERAGFSEVISTSHYLFEKYEVDEKTRGELLNAIKQLNKRENINVELYLGSEIYIDVNMLDFLEENKASTINNSRYVLFELSLQEKNIYLRETLYKLLEHGYKPILAHPERYQYIQEDIKYARELSDMGVLFQANYGSFIEWYGTAARKTVKRLLEEDYIQFLGSDVHRDNTIYPEIDKCIKEIKKIVSEDKFYELSEKNARSVLRNETIVT